MQALHRDRLRGASDGAGRTHWLAGPPGAGGGHWPHNRPFRTPARTNQDGSGAIVVQNWFEELKRLAPTN